MTHPPHALPATWTHAPVDNRRLIIAVHPHASTTLAPTPPNISLLSLFLSISLASLSLSLSMATPPSRTPPFREDCWSEDATWTLVGAWGRRFLDLNRGNLRQKDWQSVADAVNAVHGGDPKARRTDVQSKNRIDTLKKKYKAEKARVSDSPGYSSTWPFYDRMDELIGSLVSAKKPSPAEVSVSPPMGIPLLPYRKPVSAVAQPVVVAPQKRPASDPAPVVDDSYFRRNYSAVAAAAAAEVEDDDDVEDSESEAEEVEEVSAGDGMRRLARAIERLGEMYERVEGEKQRQMVELEKQRMQFTKDMEVQRMQLFMDTQVQLEKIKRAKRSNPDVLHRLAFSSAVGLWGELLAHDGKP